MDRIDASKASCRRVPQQPRSRKKVTTILNTAMRLFQESGMDQVSMREIAREADMPIATVYQYFPNKQAIVRQIWENYTSAIDRLLETELGSLRVEPTSQTVQRVVDRIEDSMADYYRRNPAFAEIRRCVDATPDLRRLNLEDTLKVADLIKSVILSVNAEAREPAVANYAIIAAEATSSTIRLGQQMDADQREDLYDSLKSFLLHIYQSVSDPRLDLERLPYK